MLLVRIKTLELEIHFTACCMRFNFCCGNWSHFIHDHKGDFKKKILSTQRGHLCRTYSYPEFRAGLGQDSGSLPIFNKITEGEGKKCEIGNSRAFYGINPFKLFSGPPTFFSWFFFPSSLFLTTLPHAHSFSSTFGCFWRSRHLQMDLWFCSGRSGTQCELSPERSSCYDVEK